MVNWLDEELHNKLASNGLFVVGHARSGTTVLGHALNTSPEICILAEANFHTGEGLEDFPAWFNKKHIDFNNPPCKACRCPPYMAGMWESLLAQRKTYRFVGDKIAFLSRLYGYDSEAYLAFLSRRFPNSYYLCTLRNPDDCISSSFHIAPRATQGVLEVSYLRALRAILDFYFSFDRVVVVQSEAISEGTFEVIANFVGVPLPEAFSEYARNYEPKFEHKQLVVSKLLRKARQFHKAISKLFSKSNLRCSNRANLRTLQFELDAVIQGVDDHGKTLTNRTES